MPAYTPPLRVHAIRDVVFRSMNSGHAPACRVDVDTINAVIEGGQFASGDLP